MTKQEYILELNEALASYPQEFRNDILEAFEGHFQEGLDNGLSEEEVIDTLGSIDEVLENIQMMSGDTQRSYSENNYSDPNSAIKANMNALKSNIKELTKQISEAVSQNINVSFDFTTDKSAEPTYYSFSHNNIPTVTINGNLDVEIIKGLENSYEFKPYQSVFSKGIPELEVNENEELADISLRSGSGLLKLTVNDAVKELNIKAPSGDVIISDLTLSSLTIVSYSGDIRCDNITSEKIDASTKSGDIYMNNTTTKELNAVSISGDVDLITGEGILNVRSTSGDIEVTNFRTESLNAASVSGDVDVTVDAVDVVASSTSGDVNVECYVEFETLKATSVSGDVELRSPNKNIHLFARTLGGDLDISDYQYEQVNRNEYLIGDASSEATLDSKSGDITVYLI